VNAVTGEAESAQVKTVAAASSISSEQTTKVDAANVLGDCYADLDGLDFPEVPDVEFDMSEVEFDGLDNLNVPAAVAVEAGGANVNNGEDTAAIARQNLAHLIEGKLDLGPGFSAVPDPELLAARGCNVQNSEKNNHWSLLRADQLCKQLGWDMSIPLGKVHFDQLDELLSILFSMMMKKARSIST
jgi:hypothetical protein